MKKGEIYYFDPEFRKLHPSEEDKKHPIVCICDTEDVSFFRAVILSHGSAPSSSPIINYKLNIAEFDKDPQYSVPGKYKEEWLVGKGFWKDVKAFPTKIAGKISIKELNNILIKLIEIEKAKDAKELKELRNEHDAEVLYEKLITIVEKGVHFEEISTTLSEYIKNIK